MKLFPSEREVARRHWRYFGKPLVMMFGIAILVGLIAGIGVVIAGLVHFHLP